MRTWQEGRSPHRAASLVTRLLLAVVATLAGCALEGSREFLADGELEHYHLSTTRIEYPDVVSETYEPAASTPAPLTVGDAPMQYWDLSLAEAIETALATTGVLRDLGGQVLTFPQSPELVRTVVDPAITETHPQFGVEAALSAFDASFGAGLFFENNDRTLNNEFLGGGTRRFQQDLHEYRAEISKRSATGGDFTLRQIVEYDANNSPGNNDPNLPWGVQVEGEFRQPLLQGAGVDFNRIAGPHGRPGLFHGVLLARINTDVSLAEFETGVRNLINDVEHAYWELYFAYRDLDVKVAGRDRALETWRHIQALSDSGQRGGELEREAQARAQYFRLEEELRGALTGRAEDRDRSLVFRGAGGVQTADRRLRLVMGVPISDGRLIRPTDEPVKARVLFDWQEVLAEALTRRVELRRQKWRIAQREFELLASRNFLLPRVDAVGRYRFRGLGHDLLDSTRGGPRFDNAFQDLTTGDFQEWQLGVEVDLPVGYRQAHAAVRHAELLLTRERAILGEQERQIVHDLSAAIAEVARAYDSAQVNFNRRLAVREELRTLVQRFQDADSSERIRLLDLLMEAERRSGDAENRYYRAIVEYTLAIKNVHYQKGSLLETNQVFLAEGPWGKEALADAQRRQHLRRSAGRLLNYLITRPWPVSAGDYPQRIEPADAPPTREPPEPLPVPDP